MGQRLNIQLYREGCPFVYANCYYHWSAYTMDALYTVKSIIDNYRNLKEEDKKDDFLLAYKLFAIGADTIDSEWYEENGERKFKTTRVVRSAGLCKDSKIMMSLLYPKETFVDGVDRNVGLISMHPDDIHNTQCWEEGRVNIYLDTEEFIFDVWWKATKDELINEYDYSRDKIKNIPDAPAYIIDEIPFDKIDEMIELLSNDHILSLDDDEYYITIE